MVHASHGSHIDRCYRAVTKIQFIRQNVRIGIIIDQEVVERIVARSVGTYGMDKLMNADAIYERQAWVAQTGYMLEGGRIVDEPAFQAGSK